MGPNEAPVLGDPTRFSISMGHSVIVKQILKPVNLERDELLLSSFLFKNEGFENTHQVSQIYQDSWVSEAMVTSFSLLEDGITTLKPPGSVTGLGEALGPVSSLPRGVSISLSFRADAVDKNLPGLGMVSLRAIHTLWGPSKIFCLIFIHHLICIFIKRVPKLCKLWPQKPWKRLLAHKVVVKMLLHN